ncbi:hypothetical protein [Nostoc sp.]
MAFENETPETIERNYHVRIISDNLDSHCTPKNHNDRNIWFKSSTLGKY